MGYPFGSVIGKPSSSLAYVQNFSKTLPTSNKLSGCNTFFYSLTLFSLTFMFSIFFQMSY